MSDTRAALPPLLAANPRLDQWVGFPAPGQVRVATGRVEIGQGVLTAMIQIAADELDVAPERIRLETGDTDLTPNEGYTAGSQSIQFGGVALRLACAEVRGLFLDHAAAAFGHAARRSRGAGRRDPPSWASRPGRITGRSRRLSICGATPLGRARGRSRRATTASSAVTQPRVDLAAKVFGQPVFVHDMAMDGMAACPRRAPAAPRRDDRRRSTRPRSAVPPRAPIDFLRDGNFLAIIGADETAVEAAAAVAPGHVAWDGVEPISPAQEEARWLLQQPTDRPRRSAPPPADASAGGQPLRSATYTRMHVAHASVGAVLRAGALPRWATCRLDPFAGGLPARAALARTLKLDPAAISVKHVQGPGCYGHNGADDAAADAAVIALRTAGHAGPGALAARGGIRLRAGQPGDGGQRARRRSTLPAARPTGPPRSGAGRHSSRPGGGGNLLAAEALPDPPPAPPAAESSAAPGAGTRNGEPLYAFAGEADRASPDRRDAGPHLVAARPRRDAQRVRDRIVRRRAGRAKPAAIRSPTACRQLADPRARAVIEKVAAMSRWRPGLAGGAGRGRGIAFARYKNIAAYAAIVAEVEVEESVRVTRVWCAADAGLVINPDGAINQLEGGIVQAISWALKEGVRLDAAGISSRDWETYPVIKFSEVPEIAVELIEPRTDTPPLGVGEAAGGPTVAAIGNAVAHALGARIRDLPMNRERVMAALLKS